MNDRNEKIRNLLVPIFSVILGLVLGAILMAAFGYNPGQGYSSMLNASLVLKEVLVEHYGKQHR